MRTPVPPEHPHPLHTCARAAALAAALALPLLLAACATGPKVPDEAPQIARLRAQDPFEVAHDWLAAALQGIPGQGAPADSLQAQALARMHHPQLVRLLRAQDGMTFRAVVAERDEPPQGQALILTLAPRPLAPDQWQVQAVTLHDARAYWPRF